MRKYRKYVVGWDNDENCVYGKDKPNESHWADPMSITEAKKYVNDLNEYNSGRKVRAIIYELVPKKS